MVLKKTRNIFLIVLLLVVSLTAFACEDSTQLRCATITEITAAGSENYGVRISFLQDKRLQDKYVDVQVKFNKTGEITFWEENQEKMEFIIEDFDEWYSIEYLKAKATSTEGSEKFEKFEKALARTYLFNYDGKIELTFRVVAGDIEDNSAKTGEILVGSEPISKQFTLKIK